ncbi:recombinase family protein [Arthrobacter sp. PAMC25284]|nr:recombinase family protein [Arthrobacter sp. PAMC25284]
MQFFLGEWAVFVGEADPAVELRVADEPFFNSGHADEDQGYVVPVVAVTHTLVVHSMDRLARNLDDLRSLVQALTRKGVRVEFVKEQLVFTGEESPLANLMLSVMGAFAEFERALIGERQREGITLAKARGAYRGRRKALTPEKAAELRDRAGAGEQKTGLAREFGISRETLYQYLKAGS